jgi:hypothetical protein
MAKKSVAGTGLDPTIQFSTLVVDDKSYKLAYSFNSIALAEAASGTNLLKGLQSLMDLSAMQLRGLLYAAMIIDKPDVTVEQASSLIRVDTINDITLAMVEAYRLSLPEKKKAEIAEAEREATE